MSAIKDYLQSNSAWVSNSDNTEFTNDNEGKETFFVISTTGAGDFLNTVLRESGEVAPGTIKTNLTEVTEVPFYTSTENFSVDINDGADSDLNGNDSDLDYPHSEGESSLSNNDIKDS